MRVTYREEDEVSTPSAPISVADFLVGVNGSLSRHSARIEGEVTSVKFTNAKAIYFTIKDTSREALLECIMWRSVYIQNGIEMKQGDVIIVSGVPEIYVPYGRFSFKANTIEYAGEGQLKRAYDELRNKLVGEGLLDVSNKRPLPAYATRIGVITSRSGVVIQDFSANLGRYGFKVTLVDSRVEGKDAIHELLSALRKLATADIEILVIMRGGGSLESLQAFNTESVVRAIANFPVPVLTGIGHDVDVTLAELVADVGSSAPTAVAEKLNENWDTLTSTLRSVESKIYSTFDRALVRLDRGLETASNRIPRRFEQMLTERTNVLTRASTETKVIFRQLTNRINSVVSTVLAATATMNSVLRIIDARLADLPVVFSRQVRARVTAAHTTVFRHSERIVQMGRAQIRTTATELITYDKSIRVVDPAYNLRLGYSLSYVNGTVVRKVSDVMIGAIITTQLADGSFTAEVKSLK